MSLQSAPPVRVYNGPSAPYAVNSRFNSDGSATQLVGFADEWGDAFGRFRTAEPYTLLESSFTYDLQPIWFEQVVATDGTVTHDTDARAALLTVTGDSGSRAMLAGRQYLPYEKGKSQLYKATYLFGAAVANVRKRVGYYDAANGFYLEQNGTSGLNIVRRSSSTGSLITTTIAQADWNIDTMDGTGPSGITLDQTAPNLLVIDGQWQGIGRVRFGFSIDGVTRYVHQFIHANQPGQPLPYVQSFTLPCRWEIESTAASAGSTMSAACVDVVSEGGVSSPNGLTFTANNTSNIATSTTRAHCLSIRPAAVFPAGSSLVNRSFIIPLNVNAIAGGADALVEVFYDCGLTGGTWTQTNTHSTIEYGVGQSIAELGVPVDSFFVAAGTGSSRGVGSQGIDSQYPLTLSVAGDNPKAMTVAVTALSGTGTARAAIGWKEIR
jgi:hypothetical protein